MIDPHWQVIDLDPVTWRNLGMFLEPHQYVAAVQPGEHGLFILHDHGQVLKVVDTLAGEPPADIPGTIEDPERLAQELYDRGEWQRVHVIDRQHLRWVAQQAQANPRRDLAIDAYYHLVYMLMWDKPGGYVSVPPQPGHWHGWTYSDIRQFLANLASPSTLALGVYSEHGLDIGLVLLYREGQIRHVTTFEGLDWTVPNPGPNQQTMTALSEALTAQFAPPSAMLLCTDAIFAGWLEALNKLAFLREAQAIGTAIWRIEL
jgi:hypothetical protein